ncbi:MAG: hypothetical protein ACTSUT_15955 [Promethearchaeota archaeon]
MAKAGKYLKSVNTSKIIIFSFFSIYLIALGIGITNFIDAYQITHPSNPLPIYVSYIPLACYVFAIFLGLGLIIFIKNITAYKTRETKSRKKIKAGSIYKQALFLIIFAFSFIPLFSPIIDQGRNNQNFSIYNSNPDSDDYWKGCSDFKLTLENNGYDIYNIQSSLSATQRINKSILLVLMGPNQFYNPIFEIPYFIDFFNSGNSILICHDYGSTSTLLWEVFFANLIDKGSKDKIPVTIFPEGVLRDNLSYAKTPEFPVIKSFGTHPTTSGISKVVLSRASCALGGPLVDFFGWNVVGRSSIYSYVDRNNDSMYKYEDDNYDISAISDLVPDFPEGLTKIPLGGYPQSVFMAKDTGKTRIFVSSDASLFNNELINEPGFDNRKFGVNIVNWLTHGEKDWLIVFDEAHIRPEYSRDLSSAGIFGFIIQYVVHLSTNPITAWIYPLLAIYTLRKYIPKKDKEEEKKKAEEEERKEEMAKFRTSSFFAKKIDWYKEKRKYGKALTLLYRRLERKLNMLLSGSKISTKNVVDMVIAKEPGISKHKVRRISHFMERIIAIKMGKRKVKTEQDFEDLFFEMEWVVNNI